MILGQIPGRVVGHGRPADGQVFVGRIVGVLRGHGAVISQGCPVAQFIILESFIRPVLSSQVVPKPLPTHGLGEWETTTEKIAL